MGPLRNPKYEQAAQALAGGSTDEEAAEIGGLDPKGRAFKANARKFCRKHGIPARVTELQVAELVRAGGGEDMIRYRRARARLELERIAYTNVVDLFEVGADGKPKLKRLDELTAAESALIAELVVDEGGKVKVRPFAKDAAIEKLMKLDGLAEPEKLDLTARMDLSKLTDEQLDAFERLIAAASGTIRHREGEGTQAS